MTKSEEIKKLIELIGLAEIKFDKKTKDFSYNGDKPVYIKFREFYLKKYREFDRKIRNQYKEEFTKELVQDFIETFRIVLDNLASVHEKRIINVLFDKRDGEFSDNAEASNKQIEQIYNAQEYILKKMRGDVKYLARVSNFGVKNNFDDKLSLDIKLPTQGKAAFNLNKKESTMFFFLLEKVKLISFESDFDRNKFIEYNFQYTEDRENKNKGKQFDLEDVNRDFSNFKDYSKTISNNKTKDKLIKLLIEELGKVDLYS